MILESRYEPETFLVQTEVVPSWYKRAVLGNNINTDRKERGSCGLDAGDRGEAPIDRMSQAIEP